MRCFIVILLLLGAPSVAAGADRPAAPMVRTPQAAPVATLGSAFAWDYSDTQIAAGAVTRFEIQVDAGAFVSVDMATVFTDAQTQDGFKSYKAALPALVPGPHTIAVRACNTDLCGDAASLPFVLAVKPGAATNVRFIGGGD